MGAFLTGPCANTGKTYPSLVSLASAVTRNKWISYQGGKEGESAGAVIHLTFSEKSIIPRCILPGQNKSIL